jgi:hypothetical protein
MYTQSTLSALWGVDVATIEDLCRRGRLHGRFVRGGWQISAGAVAQFLRRRERRGQHRPPQIRTTHTLHLA